MKYLFLSLALFLASCGPNFYLKKAERNTRRAIIHGAVIAPDTVYKNIEVITQVHHYDTVLQVVNFNDTITITKDRIITKLKVNTVEKTVFVDTKCPSDTIIKRVPFAVKQYIQAESKTPWWIWLVCGAAGVITALALLRR